MPSVSVLDAYSVRQHTVENHTARTSADIRVYLLTGKEVHSIKLSAKAGYKKTVMHQADTMFVKYIFYIFIEKSQEENISYSFQRVGW